MERQISEIYKQSQSELTKNWDIYMRQQGAYVKNLQDEYYEMKRIGADAEARKIGKTLGVEKRKLTLQNDRYKAMVEETARKISQVNQIAIAYLNGELPSIYTINYNHLKKDVENIGVSFSMVDEFTVARRVKDGDIKLPRKKISVPKDMRWNTKKLNSAVLQGILQGESMDKIADRILPIVNSNEKAAIRNARTMVTGAQNQGRLDSYSWAQSQGVVMLKVWMSAWDSRTRDSHRRLDEVKISPNEKFDNGLMYPGDPNGMPREVYNCRCTLGTDIIGVKRADGGINYVGTRRLADKALSTARRAEPQITKILKHIVDKNGGYLDGLDHRFKSKDSLERKIAEGSIESNIPKSDYAKRITDVLRYTNISEAKNLTNDFFSIKNELKRNGYTMARVKNTISDKNAVYRGINTLVKDPNGYLFELQFHTPESIDLKEVNHKLYEKQRLSTTTEKEKAKLNNKMLNNSKSIKVPPNSKKIVNKSLDKEIKQW